MDCSGLDRPCLRNVCEHLGIAPPSVTHLRPPQPTPAQVEPVNEWIRGCDIAWIVCGSL